MASRQRNSQVNTQKSSEKKRSPMGGDLYNTQTDNKPATDSRNWEANQSSIIEGGSSED
jgi:hypothetical protein